MSEPERSPVCRENLPKPKTGKTCQCSARVRKMMPLAEDGVLVSVDWAVMPVALLETTLLLDTIHVQRGSDAGAFHTRHLALVEVIIVIATPGEQLRNLLVRSC